MINNALKEFVPACLGVLLGVFAPLLAQATCTQADLAGTWYAMFVDGDVIQSEFNSTVRCKVVVSSTGAVTANSTGCKARTSNDAGTGVINRTVAITGGSLTVNSSCAISGRLGINDGAGNTTLTVQYAQMARDKNTFAFTIYHDGDGASFGEAVKQ
ncbi:MAG: hypothetical protein HZB57_03385 [Gammaproteobacteria bacterium]|nr:hypothetical protein [Gammaproteobacteria bacterium]